MQIGTFRKNVMKTVGTKPAKLGLKLVAKNTQRTNVFHAAISLKANVGRLLAELNDHMLGKQFQSEMADKARPVFGDVGADIVTLAKLLKVKTPTSTKKIKLVGDRMAALTALDIASTGLLISVSGIFNGPVMKTEKKVVTIPATGKKEKREVQVVDAEKEATMEAKRVDQTKELLEQVIKLYWPLSFDIFKTAPAPIFAEKFERLKAENPTVEFDTETETEAVPA